ncbi:MAG: hypothetical protein U1F61_08895 [Opitutaceae bacterium]
MSLFREEVGDPSAITRLDGAGGDGGVEAYCEQGHGKTVGLQAKYFDKLGASQWSQIRASIKEARRNHPALKIYHVATPLDLTLGAARTWKKLKQAEKTKRPALTLVWWGASELIHFLTQAVHAGRATYWFGLPQFSAAWLDGHNARARADLDTRYTPEYHVRVSSQDVLSSFAREPAFVDQYYDRAREVWKAMRGVVEYPLPKELPAALSAPFDAVVAATKEQLPRLGDGVVLPGWSEADDARQKLGLALAAFSTAADAAIEEVAKIPAPPRDPSASYQASPRERLDFRRHEISKGDEALYEFHRFLERHEGADRRRLLIIGEAGSGKSHLLARFVEESRQRGQAALFLLGEYFTASTDPWGQLIARLGWTGTADELVAALNYAGETAQLPALLVIDAVNETPDRAVWLHHLGGFSSRLEPWPWVRLIVSCRSDFVAISLPPTVAERRDPQWAFVEHRGFGNAAFQATAEYFAAYGVRTRDHPPLLPEFQNPLFLKTFCEAFENSQVPAGSLTLDIVMRRRVDKAGRQIERAIDCPVDTTRSALETLAGLIADHDWQPVPVAAARSAIDALFPGRGRSRSLYQHLCSSGLLMEVGHFDYETRTHEIRVRFAYERFSDYFMAGRLLAGIKAVKPLRAAWTRQGHLATWNSVRGYLKHRGLLKALAILLPGRFGLEMAALVTHRDVQRFVREDFLASLAWREPVSFTPASRKLFGTAASAVPPVEMLRLLIRLASVPDHPWNAKFLDARLHRMPLWERELVWTIPVSQMLAEEGEHAVPAIFVRWLFGTTSESLSGEQARLVATVLCWFCSSNDRGFRRRATLAAIRVLQGRAEIAAELVDRFYNVDDPYVVERVLAVAAGVAVRERTRDKLGVLVKTVWRRVFNPRLVRPHILLRDFAFTVMESAHDRGCLPAGVTRQDYQPPYRSRWPKIWSDARSRRFGKRQGWRRIVHSIEPEYGNGIGGYGDFGRYTMEAHMRSWLNVRRTEPYPKKGEEHSFDSLVARSWVLQRVAGLGWTPARFEAYENDLRDGRLRNDQEDAKQERISKKYQWIALHELEALASDHYHFVSRREDQRNPFAGAWQLFSRDFDPAQPLLDPLAVRADESKPSVARTTAKWWCRYPDPFGDRKLVGNPSAWVRTLPDDPKSLLLLPSAPGLDGPALLLNGWFTWNEPEPYPPRTRDMGQCHQFIHVRSWMFHRTERAARLRFLRQTHFWGDGMQLPEFGSEGLGEYPWSERFRSLRAYCAHNERWGAEFPAGFVHTVSVYSEGDASATVPSPQLAELLALKWSGHDFDFVDDQGNLVAFAPRGARGSSTPCLVERKRLQEILAKHGLALVWAIAGERYCFNHFASHSVADSMISFSGVVSLDDDGGIRGGITVREITDVPTQATGNRPNSPYRRRREWFKPRRTGRP